MPSSIPPFFSFLSFNKPKLFQGAKNFTTNLPRTTLGTKRTTPLSLKSLCGGGVPSSHPSLGLSVFFLSFFQIRAHDWARDWRFSKKLTILGTGLARTGTTGNKVIKIPAWWRRAVLPSLPCVVRFLSFFQEKGGSKPQPGREVGWVGGSRNKANGQPKGGMGGRHAATTQGF